MIRPEINYTIHTSKKIVIKGPFVLVESIFYKNTYNYSYKVIIWQKIFYPFNIIYEECGGKQEEVALLHYYRIINYFLNHEL